MCRLATKKHNSGFSLLEVLVAFSIAALSLGVLFQIYTKGTTAVILGEEYAQAVVIAESRLAYATVFENLEVSETSGRENDRYDWEVSVEDYVDETASDFTPVLLLKQVKVTVTWDSVGNSRSINLHSLKPVPAT